ncbi:MAG: anti-sigma factor family protein, partial [Paraburkholderia terricola]
MSDQQTPIGEEELHAYVDGTLSDERRAEVERALEQNPELAARISDYFSLNNMFHERYDRVLNEPVPNRLQAPAPRRWRIAANWPQFAGMAAALVLGV